MRFRLGQHLWTELILLAVLPATVIAAEPAQQSATRRGNTTAVIDSVLVTGARQRDTLALDEVTPTGSRLGLAPRDLPASVSIVTHETIELRGARTAVEALEAAVGMTGGISVGSIPNYATRGFTGNDITVMRDGIRQNTASQSSRPLDAFLFDRIEVLKGPASLLYGEGAIGGAVNYVSKMPDEVWRGETFASAGAWDNYRAGLGVGGPTGIDGLYFRADAAYTQGGGYVERSDFEYNAAAASLLWEASERTHVLVSGTYLKDAVESYYGTPLIYDTVLGANAPRLANSATDRLVNARIDERTRRLNYNNYDNFARTENSFWRFIIESQLTDQWAVRNELYAATQALQWRNTESTVWNPATSLVQRGSFLLIYRDDLQWGNRLDLTWSGTLAGRANKFVIGALHDDNDQIRNSGQNNYISIPTPANVPLIGFNPGFGPQVDFQKTARIDTETLAIYIEDVYTATDYLKLIGGLRYEEIRLERLSYAGAPTFFKEYTPWTGRFGLIYSLTSAMNLYASYSCAAQPVSQLVSLTAAQSDFSLQKGRQYEIGFKGSLWQDKAAVTLALFDIEKNDLLTSTIINNVRVNSQIGAQVSQGLELAFTATPLSNWHVDANFAWTWQAEYKDFMENLGAGVISRDGNTPPNVPEYVAGVFVAHERGPWLMTAGLRYVGERQGNSNNGIQLDNYMTADASVSRSWGSLTATMRGRNLTDETYAEWASGGGLMVRLAEPRSAEFTLKYAF